MNPREDNMPAYFRIHAKDGPLARRHATREEAECVRAALTYGDECVVCAYNRVDKIIPDPDV